MKQIRIYFTLLIMAFTLQAVQFSAVSQTKVSVDRLPAKAKKFISDNYAPKKATSVTLKGSIFNVTMSDKSQISFSKTGDWTELSAENGGQIPTKAIPEKMLKKAQSLYKGEKFVNLKKTSTGYEGKLSIGTRLIFDKNYSLKEMLF